jgi:Undecaprenyl-phosphate galactose phosphotransferase WbaP
MKSFSENISLDVTGSKAHPFIRRRLTDALMLSAVDGLMLYLSLVFGDFLLSVWRSVPMQLESMLLMIPAWWVGSWLTRLVPGWGMGAVEELRRIQWMLMALFAAGTVALFFGLNAGQGSRITFIGAYAAAAVLIPMGRVAARALLLRLNCWGVPAVIYGDSETVPVVADLLKSDRSLGFVPKGVLSDDFGLGSVIGGLPVIGSLQNQTRRMPVAVVALPEVPRKQLIDLLEGPLQVYHRILLIPDLSNAPSLWVKPCDLQGILGLEIRQNLLDPLAGLYKTLIERVFVILTFPVWGAITLLFMLLIWLQDMKSPVYAQKRIGQNNKVFNVYKLRTMVPDAETVLRRTLAKNPALKAEWEQHYKLKKDPRITFIGALLRKTSLDELPQLWCVLTGNMSLVGPRPLPKYHHDELESRTQNLRVRVRPGVTGMWQVSGRSESGTAGMDRWDTYYVTNWSIWLDLVILARTVKVVLFGSGAY